MPWVGKNSAISCLKSRDYSSSVPARYIPKRSSEVKKSETSLSTKGSGRKEFRELSDGFALKNEVKHGRSDLQNYRDFDKKFPYSNSLSNDVEQASSELEDQVDNLSGVVGDDELMDEPEEVSEELNLLQNSKTMHEVEKAAIELLAGRAFTAVELRKKLCRKGFSLDAIEAVIKDLIKRGLINDSLYAEAFSRSRWSSSSWGPKRIKQALFTKGVSEVDAQKAIKLVFEDRESDEDGGSNEDQELIHGMSKPSMDHLFVQASKQWLRGREVPKETRKSRIVRWLQYRGFNWGVIGFILKKLEAQHPP
ncbi:uncharacterized protein LOC126788920 [Argentina anserina]|uniref:uncharacterized protein LOC126788920 n=1 Tax=Argentina anserina TaxID=57926 RepID=UPI00217629DD|nr:uncharacterized protein LOC126788920 [Potentilla anserina]